ncbi:hypothetical protein E2C01_089183 [Portunus trituberculatus]|uniref:Uncharacterized protein n=1 Tax=Portunus trituberculatus TaxID=210409 RepID=A0A5B7JI29_PORTR|nr:hypothetical protein [Portunus trituberculatus]
MVVSPLSPPPCQPCLGPCLPGHSVHLFSPHPRSRVQGSIKKERHDTTTRLVRGSCSHSNNTPRGHGRPLPCTSSPRLTLRVQQPGDPPMCRRGRVCAPGVTEGAEERSGGRKALAAAGRAALPLLGAGAATQTLRPDLESVVGSEQDACGYAECPSPLRLRPGMWRAARQHWEEGGQEEAAGYWRGKVHRSDDTRPKGTTLIPQHRE